MHFWKLTELYTKKGEFHSVLIEAWFFKWKNEQVEQQQYNELNLLKERESGKEKRKASGRKLTNHSLYIAPWDRDFVLFAPCSLSSWALKDM